MLGSHTQGTALSTFNHSIMQDFLIAYCVAGTVLGTAELRMRRTSSWAQRLVWWGDSSEEE